MDEKDQDLTRQISKLVIVIAMLLLTTILDSCNNQTTKIKTEINYKMDMLVKNLNKTRRGVIVLDDKDFYTIQVEMAGRFNLFTFRTCSREIAIENADRNIFKRHKVKFNYRPNLIEMRPGCNAEVWGHDVKGRHSRAMIFFRRQSMDLTAFIVCGNRTEYETGISACQGRAGLVQGITFESEVKVKTMDEKCALDIDLGKVFEFELVSGGCQYIFMENGGDHRAHELFTFGYDQIPIRK